MVLRSITISLEIHYTNAFQYINYKMEWPKFNRKYSASGGRGEGGDFTEYLRTEVLPVKYFKFYKSYYTLVDMDGVVLSSDLQG